MQRLVRLKSKEETCGFTKEQHSHSSTENSDAGHISQGSSRTCLSLKLGKNTFTRYCVQTRSRTSIDTTITYPRCVTLYMCSCKQDWGCVFVGHGVGLGGAAFVEIARPALCRCRNRPHHSCHLSQHLPRSLPWLGTVEEVPPASSLIRGNHSRNNSCLLVDR